MMLSVIIPTCNRNDLLSKCLDHLLCSIQKIEIDYEVIVTDDSKDDLTKKLVETKYSWTKWVNGPKSGPASNRNNGAKNASGDWLIFIDDDCLPDIHLMSQYYDAIKSNSQIEVFEGCIKADRQKQSFTEESPVNETGGYLWSCNFMIKRALFMYMHGFDEGFPYPVMEDVELCYRLQRAKKVILFVESAFVVHPWRSQKKIFTVTIQRFKSLLYFLNKHPEQSEKINSKYYLLVVWNETKSLFFNSFRYKFRGFFGSVIYTITHFYFALYFFAFGLKEMLTKRNID